MTREERLARDGCVNPVLFYHPRNQWGVFSNFSEHPVDMIHPWSQKPTRYATSEHRYQAMKATCREDHDHVASADGPMQSKERGGRNGIRLREDWGADKDGACYAVMVEVVEAKVAQHDEMRAMLLRTGARHIYEDSATDDIWGWRCREDYRGRNLLGEALMEVRATIPPPPHEQQPCAGCGQPCWAANGVAFWVRTALGNTVLRSHTGECEALAVVRHPEQPVKRIPRPPDRK